MVLESFSILSYTIIALVSGSLICGLLIFLGRELARERRLFVGTALPRRTSLEVGALNLALLIPTMYLSINLGLNRVPALLEPVLNLLAAIFIGLGFILLPLWAATRLTIPHATTPIAYVWAYGRGVIGMLLAVFGTSVFGYVLLPWLLSPAIQQPVTELLLLSGTVTVTFLVLFLFLRGMMELVRFTLQRRYIPKAIFPRSKTILYTRAYQALMILIAATLIIWVVAIFLYLNRSPHPDWTYLPPVYRNLAPTTSFLTPLERPPILAFTLSLPPILILLIGLVFALRRIPEETVLLFVLLCLLYGLWNLDIYPNLGGSFLWAVRLLAWLFVAPLQILFLLVFPMQEESITGELRPLWALVRFALLGGFLLMAPLWLYLHFRTLQGIENLMQTQGYLIPFVFLWGAIGIIALPLSWIIGVYILIHTRRGLNSAANEIHYNPESPSSECAWRDLVTSREPFGVVTRLFTAKRQFKWIATGFYGIGAFILLALIVVPLVSPKAIEWADAAPRFGITALFVCVAIAFEPYRSPDIERKTIYNITREVFIIILASAFVLLEFTLEDFITDRGVPVVPIILILIFLSLIIDRIPIKKWLLPRIYKHLLPDHREYQENFNKLGQGLNEIQYSLPALLDILTKACPKKALAAWLLLPLEQSSEPEYTVHSICHAAGCQSQCLGLFRKGLDTTENSTHMRLPGDLEARLRAGLSGENTEVLVVYNLFEEEKSDTTSSIPRNAQPVVEQSTLRQLRYLRIALLTPLGSPGWLRGIYVIATNHQGDFYDQNDLTALAQLAHNISVWMM